MAGQKKRTSRMSLGGGKKSNLSKEAKRQAKFAAKRENGNAYKYAPIPFEKGTVEYNREKMERAEKAKSKKLPIAQYDSMFRKLQNYLDKEQERLAKIKAAK